MDPADFSTDAATVALVEAAVSGHPECPPPVHGTRAELAAWFFAAGLPCNPATVGALRLLTFRRLAAEPGGTAVIFFDPPTE